MADTLTVGQELEGRILATIRRSDEIALETMKAFAGAIGPMRATIRSVTPPLIFDFSEQLLISQRKFAEDVLHLSEGLTTPTRVKSAGEAQKPA